MNFFQGFFPKPQEHADERKRRKAFTLIELLIVIVLIGILATFMIVKFGDVKEQAYVSAIQNDLRALVTAQEIHYDETGGYAQDPLVIEGYGLSEGVEIIGMEVSSRGFFAVYGHELSDMVCVMPRLEPQDAGRVECLGEDVFSLIVSGEYPDPVTFTIPSGMLAALEADQPIFASFLGSFGASGVLGFFGGMEISEEAVAHWDFGDGTKVSGPLSSHSTVQHTYADDQSYAVSVRIVDAGRPTRTGVVRVGGDRKSDTSAGIIPDEPSAAFTITPTNPRVGDLVTFDGSGSQADDALEITDWSWTFGDGGTATGEIVTHTYSGPGEYLVELGVSDSHGAVDYASRWLDVEVETFDLNLGFMGAGTGQVQVEYGETTESFSGPITISGIEEGTNVTVTASPEVGSIFEGWTGDVVSASSSESFTMTGDRNVSATFEVATYSLTLGVAGDGAGSVAVDYGEGTTSYSVSDVIAGIPHGASVTLTATPDSESEFAGWSGAATGTNPVATLSMTSDLSATATFDLSTVDLTLSFLGDGRDHGRIRVIYTTPEGSVNVLYRRGDAMPIAIPHGTEVELRRQTISGGEWLHWGGAVSGSATPVFLTMDEDKSVSGRWDLQDMTLSWQIDGFGAGSVQIRRTGGVTYLNQDYNGVGPVSGTIDIPWGTSVDIIRTDGSGTVTSSVSTQIGSLLWNHATHRTTMNRTELRFDITSNVEREIVFHFQDPCLGTIGPGIECLDGSFSVGNNLFVSRDLANMSENHTNMTSICESATNHGRSDWRLPTESEAVTYVNNRSILHSSSFGFPNSYYVWTSETQPRLSGGTEALQVQGWGDNTRWIWTNTTNLSFVRAVCVRTN